MLSRMLCHVGIHRPVTPGEWHLGYCFTRCSRCHTHMVKSVLSRWKVPKKLRVVRGKPNAVLNLDRELTRREAARNTSAPSAADKPAEQGASDSEPRPRDGDAIDPDEAVARAPVAQDDLTSPVQDAPQAIVPPVPELPPKVQVELKVTPVEARSSEPSKRPPLPAPDSDIAAAVMQGPATSGPRFEKGSPFDFSDFDRSRPIDAAGEAAASDALRQAQ